MRSIVFIFSALAIIVTISYLLLLKYNRDKTKSKSFFIRLFYISVFLGLSLVELVLLYYGCSNGFLNLSLWGFMAMQLPIRRVNVKSFKLLAIILLASISLSLILKIIFHNIVVDITATIFTLILFVHALVYLNNKKFNKIITTLKNTFVWETIEDYSTLFHSFVYLVIFLIYVVCICFYARGWSFLVLAMLLLYQLFMLYRSTYGYMAIMYRKNEVKNREMILGVQKGEENIPLYDKEFDRMKELYNKIVNFMEEKRPFLNSEYNMDMMTKDLLSNRVYLSKTINTFSGQNFRQFINYHRIMYAVELLKEDDKMTVNEISVKAGFNSPVTFNLAFKMFMKSAPYEWIVNNLRLKKLK